MKKRVTIDDSGTYVLTKDVSRLHQTEQYSFLHIKISEIENLLKESKRLKSYWIKVNNKRKDHKIRSSFVNLNKSFSFCVDYEFRK